MSIEPFGPDTFYLNQDPYFSRVNSHENTVPANNYVMVAYKPGQPLQAAEINEIQDHFYRMSSLTTQMQHNWLGGPGLMWDSDWDGGTDGLIHEDAVGIGQDDGTHLVVHGPGWSGTTPLYPFNNPSLTSNSNTSLVTVGIGNSITVTCKRGWYLVESPLGYFKGLKVWMYLNDDLSKDGLPTNGGEYYVGFEINVSHVDSSADDTLEDQTGGGSITSATADRVKLSITGLDNGTVDGTTISPIMKFRSGGRSEVRYMNNLLIDKW
jgi:hypothetical protein